MDASRLGVSCVWFLISFLFEIGWEEGTLHYVYVWVMLWLHVLLDHVCEFNSWGLYQQILLLWLLTSWQGSNGTGIFVCLLYYSHDVCMSDPFCCVAWPLECVLLMFCYFTRCMCWMCRIGYLECVKFLI